MSLSSVCGCESELGILNHMPTQGMQKLA